MFDFYDEPDGVKSVKLVSVANALTNGSVDSIDSLDVLFKSNPRVGQIICECASLIDHCYNGKSLF